MSVLSTKLITQTFRLHGLSITPDAMQHLVDQAPSYKLPPAQFLSQLLSKIDKTSLKQSLIDKRELQKLLRAFKSTAAAAPTKKASPFALEDILGSQYPEFVADGSQGATTATSRPAPAAARPTQLVEESFKVVSALAMPRLRYNTKRHKVERLNDERGSLLGSAQSKIDMYKTWWYNAHLREGNGLVGAGAITTIESLAGRYSGRWRLMGILSEAEYGLHYIEDPTGRLLVDLSHAKAKRPRLFTEGGLVLVEGKMKDEKLMVELIDVPGAAQKEGGPYIPSPQVCDSMSYEETIIRAMGDGGDKGMVVVFSDIRVDNAIAMTRLESVLRSFAVVVETHKPREKLLFVLIGDFFARNKNVHVFPRVIRTPPKPRTVYPFDPLADVLSRFPGLMPHARFVLVPGPSDPASLTASFALPRDPLPGIMLPPSLNGGGAKRRSSHQDDDEHDDDDDVDSDGGSDDEDDDGEGEEDGGKRKRSSTKKKNEGVVADVIRGSNPCRVKYVGQELLFYRGDMQDKFLRYALAVPPADGDDHDAGTVDDVPRFEQAARTIADAGHLSPFPQAAQPVYWDHVQALYMDPLPDLLVLADNAPPFALTHASSLIVNPGSFSTSPFVALYTPSTRACRLLVSS